MKFDTRYWPLSLGKSLLSNGRRQTKDNKKSEIEKKNERKTIAIEFNFNLVEN